MARRTRIHTNNKYSRHPMELLLLNYNQDNVFAWSSSPNKTTLFTLEMAEYCFVDQTTYRVSGNSTTSCTNQNTQKTTDNCSGTRPEHVTDHSSGFGTCSSRSNKATGSGAKQRRDTTHSRNDIRFGTAFWTVHDHLHRSGRLPSKPKSRVNPR